jgi:hypothetical protein
MTEVETKKTIEEEFGTIDERKRYTNTWGMSDIQLAKRDIQVKQLKELYPTIPISWIETMYSWVETAPEEEIKKAIEKDKAKTEPAYKSRQTGGIIKGSITVEDPDPEEKKE